MGESSNEAHATAVDAAAATPIPTPAPAPAPHVNPDFDPPPGLPPALDEAIFFCSAVGSHGFLSNFHCSPFHVDGTRWPSSEHWYQAQKFLEEGIRERVRSAGTPMKAAMLGRRRDLPLRRDWEEVKEDAMRRAVLAKFEQNGEVRRALLATGDARLVEHTARDAYWGDGGDGSGRNRLGVILMETREQLRGAAAVAAAAAAAAAAAVEGEQGGSGGQAGAGAAGGGGGGDDMGCA